MPTCDAEWAVAWSLDTPVRWERCPEDAQFYWGTRDRLYARCPEHAEGIPESAWPIGEADYVWSMSQDQDIDVRLAAARERAQQAGALAPDAPAEVFIPTPTLSPIACTGVLHWEGGQVPCREVAVLYYLDEGQHHATCSRHWAPSSSAQHISEPQYRAWALARTPPRPCVLLDKKPPEVIWLLDSLTVDLTVEPVRPPPPPRTIWARLRKPDF